MDILGLYCFKISITKIRVQIHIKAECISTVVYNKYSFQKCGESGISSLTIKFYKRNKGNENWRFSIF